MRICAGGAGQPASLLRLEVQIGEMFGSDRNRPKDTDEPWSSTPGQRTRRMKTLYRVNGEVHLKKL